MTTNRYKVLLASSSSGSQGGGELYLDGLAEGLSGLGHEVHSLLADHPRMDGLGRLLSRWGPVVRIPYRNTYDRLLRCGGAVMDRSTVRRLAGTLKQIRPDVVHVNKQNVEDGLDLLLAAERSGLPTVATIHNTRSMTDLRSRLGGIRDRVAARTLGQVTCQIIAVAEAGARQLRSYGGGAIEPSRVHTVWNGIRPAPDADRGGVRREWNCGEGQVVLGCVARLEPEKDPLFLVRLLAALPEHVHLAWVGDGRMRESFLAATDQAGVRSRVHFDGWRTDARTRLAGFDAFVMPSLYEGFPFAPLEAMAAGLPCVVSGVDGMGEAVEDGISGWLCPPKDQDAWLARLGPLTADRQLRARMGAEGLRRVNQCFSLAAMASGATRVYAQLLEPQPRQLPHPKECLA